MLAKRLVSSPPFVTKPGLGQSHAPGWVSSMTHVTGQHLVFDAEVVDGLVYAYRARAALDLPDSTVRAIRDAIHSTARGSFWRYPTIRLNQVNWYALMYAADATVTGDNTLLKRDMSLQLRRFFAGGGQDRQLRSRHALPLPPESLGQHGVQPRLRRVREHRAHLHALL